MSIDNKDEEDDDDDKKSNPNIEWKKESGIDQETRASRRLDLEKLAEYEAKDKKSIQKVSSPKDSLSKNLSNLQKKASIVRRDAYHDEEDENDFSSPLPPSELDNTGISLLSALSDDEKKQLDITENLNRQTHQTTELNKGLTINAADKIIQEAKPSGINKNLAAKKIENITPQELMRDSSLKKIIKEDLAKDLKVKSKDIADSDLVNLLRGVKRIRHIGGEKAIEKMEVKDVADAGEKDKTEKDIANIVLEKTGRSPDKKFLESKKLASKEIDLKQDYAKKKIKTK